MFQQPPGYAISSATPLPRLVLISTSPNQRSSLWILPLLPSTNFSPALTSLSTILLFQSCAVPHLFVAPTFQFLVPQLVPPNLALSLLQPSWSTSATSWSRSPSLITFKTHSSFSAS